MTAAESGQLIVVLSALILGRLLEEKLAYYTHIFLYWHLKMVD